MEIHISEILDWMSETNQFVSDECFLHTHKNVSQKKFKKM